MYGNVWRFMSCQLPLFYAKSVRFTLYSPSPIGHLLFSMKQILVIKPSSLGDIIHALMVVEALGREKPELQVDWVVRDIFAPFVEACDTVRRTHIFWRKGGLVPFGQLVTQIRETGYDAVLDMQGLARSGLLTLLSGVPRRECYGRSDAREFSSLAYGKKATLPQPAACAAGVAGAAAGAVDEGGAVASTSGSVGSVSGTKGGGAVHAVDILRQFLPLFGVDAGVPLGTLTFSGVEPSAEVAAVVACGRPLYLLFPESRRPEKEWAGFAALTNLLLSGLPASGTLPLVCWLGSARVEDGGRWQGENFVNLSGRTSIAELPLLVGHSSVVVANDSGPMHLAAAMGKPVVALFGPTDPRRYGPYPLSAPTHRVLCAPSGLLADITPQQVVDTIDDLLLHR